MIQKAYKYRIYPNQEQEIMINKTFGCCRFIYNYGLAKIKDAYEKDGTRIKISDISKEIPVLKKEEDTCWLSEVPSIALIHTLRNLDAAYKNFFRELKKAQKQKVPKKVDPPAFKNKFSRKSFKFHQGYKINFTEGTIDAPKLKGLKVIYHREFIGTPKTCTISKNSAGEYYLSVTVETMGELPEKPKIENEKTAIIHLGLRNFAYIKIGNELQTIDHPQFFIKSLDRIKLLDKRLSHRKNANKGRKKDDEFKGANINKARLKRAKLYNKIKNQRAAFLHNLSKELMQNKNITTIVVENWKIKEMTQDNKYLSKYIADSGWRNFWTISNYKADWYGVNFVQAEKDFPSSKTCSECGHENKELKAKIKWECPVCKTKHEREENALLNLAKHVH